MNEDLRGIIDDCETSMVGAIDQFQRELGRIRTGRAKLSILDGVRVSYYGSPTPLNQIAALAVADARLITIKPWEKGLVGDIEKSILKSDIGLTPNSDGELIRLPIPSLTGERRQELVKVVKRVGEDGKISIRKARRDSNDLLKTLDEFGEDDVSRCRKDIQELTDRYIEKVDTIVKGKESEILEV